MKELTKLILDDMKPALGVTEPGAIAYAAAKAKSYLEGEVEQVCVAMNSGMYKNAFTCGIPNSSEVGNVFAAALGVVAGNAEKGLESLEDVRPEDNTSAKKLIEQGKVQVELSGITSRIFIEAFVKTTSGEATVTIRDSHTNIVKIVVLIEQGKVQVELSGITSRIFIEAFVKTTSGEATVTIRDSHTNIVKIVVNGKIVLDKESEEVLENKEENKTHAIHNYTLEQLVKYVETEAIEELLFIREAYKINWELFEEGLRNPRTTFARYLLEKNGGEIISSNEQATASLLCNAAIEARVIGLDKPAMSITGSGAHGIIATMPLYAAYKVNGYCESLLCNAAIEARVIGLDKPAMSITGSGAHGIIATMPLYAAYKVNGYCEEKLLRATALSYLVCMYIKEYSGKLSAFCGCAIAAGTGMACALVYLRGGTTEMMKHTINNMAMYIKEYSGKLSAFCGCAIAAGTGMACALVYLRGGTTEMMKHTINNMASSITGMICDGGNQGCTMKGIAAVDAAYQSVDFAMHGIYIQDVHGINGNTAEETMRNMGLIASPGMVETEGTIVKIFEDKLKK